MRKIQVMKFAADWNGITEGQNKFKLFYLQAVYSEVPEVNATLGHLSPRQRRATIQADHKESFRVWRRQHEREITARNQLLNMYLLVGGSPSHRHLAQTLTPAHSLGPPS